MSRRQYVRCIPSPKLSKVARRRRCVPPSRCCSACAPPPPGHSIPRCALPPTHPWLHTCSPLSPLGAQGLSSSTQMQVRSPLLTRAADRRPLRMCAADGSSPLQRLVVPDATEVQRPGVEDLVAAEGKTQTYGKDDAIHAQLAAARLRSYAQDRKGCCSKASSYLDSTMARCDEATRDQAEDA